MLAVGTLAILTACGGGGTAGGAGETSPTTAGTATTSSEEQTTEPSIEPTEPESTGPVETKPSIDIANAPIGGDDGYGPQGCAKVNWLGRKPIPDGITIKLGSVYLDPPDIFELDQGSCSGDQAPSCAGLEWKGEDPPGCYVGARQVKYVDTSETDLEVHIILPVTATCASQADCDSLAADPENQDGSSVDFEPDGDFGKPSETPSESPSEFPSESPSEFPSESPTDG